VTPPTPPPGNSRQGGREARDTVRSARHGLAVPRGQQPVADGGGGRFGRMFPSLPPCEVDDTAIEALAECTVGRPTRNNRIPAGYTYFGQFVDHDITFDPQSSLERANDPHALTNFRTPRFDLDSLYGSGPADQPFLYDWDATGDRGVKLLVGGDRTGAHAPVDLPRNDQGRALVGDARNDENLIVSQLHLVFIRFHNKVVDRVRHRAGGLTPSEVLTEAQRIVRWHYQWIVVHDFLERIVGREAYKALRDRADGRAPAVARWLSAWRSQPFMPIEYSGAAYRFGHSMVKAQYDLNATALGIPIFRPAGEEGDHLGGLRRLPTNLVIDWKLFFFVTPAPTNAPNRSSRIDPVLVAPLSRLPPDNASLAKLNLRRGHALGLPSGADVARAMSIQPLTLDELSALHEQPDPEMTDARFATLQARIETLPLWLYVLVEARLRGDSGGLSLGPVGAGIVSEVLLGLLEADPNSYLQHQPAWKPELPGDDSGDFTMLDLVGYVEDPDSL
jgi:hypothetical protein